jgi:tetratricopeptide (TPR) repeat protein
MRHQASAYQLYLKGRFYWNKRTGEALKKAIDYFSQAIEDDPGFALAYAGLADCYAGLGEKDQAFAWLEKAYEQHSFNMAWLNVEPRWDSLRSDPRFADLVRRVGLPQ